MTISSAVLLSLVLGQGVTAAPQQAVAGASIEGVVVDYKSGEPVDRAIVELRRTQPTPVSRVPFPLELPPGQIAFFNEAAMLMASAPITFTTGPDGKFAFKDAPAAEYRLYATRITGHVPAEYGQRTPTGAGNALTVTAGQKLSGITLRMAPVGSISGRIVDAAGDPVPFASVELLRSGYQDGKRRLIPGQAMRTDDRGEYRLHSLPPGQYYIAAKPWDARSTRGQPASETTIVPNRFAARESASSPLITRRVLESGEIVEETWMSVYYSGTPDPRAARPIPLSMGENISGIDISLALSPVPARRVRGLVFDGATGAPAAGALIRLTPREQLAPAVIMPTAVADPKGYFEVAGVLPAAYSLFVSGTVTGYMPVDASGGDVENIQIVGVKGVDIPMRVTFDEGARPAASPTPAPSATPAPSGAPALPIRVTLIREPGTGSPTGAFVITAGWPGIPANTLTPPMQPLPTGNFVLRDVSLGEYRVSVFGLSPGAYVKSIRRGQIDVLRDGLRVAGAASPTDDPLEIAIGANAGVLTGRVLNDARDPAPNVTVALVPTALRRSRVDLYQSVSTDSNGAFRFQGIVPDEYKLFSWEDVVTGAWHDPDFIRPHENRGLIVTVGPGANPPQELKVIP